MGWAKAVYPKPNFLGGSLWPQVIFPKRKLGNSGTKLWPWISKDPDRAWVCLETIESLPKTWISKWSGPMTTQSQSKTLETAPTQNCHAGGGCEPWAGGGRIRSTTLCSQCNSVQLLVPLPAPISALWKTDCPLAIVMSALLWTKKKPTCSSLEFDAFERQGKTISSHLRWGVFFYFT